MLYKKLAKGGNKGQPSEGVGGEQSGLLWFLFGLKRVTKGGCFCFQSGSLVFS